MQRCKNQVPARGQDVNLEESDNTQAQGLEGLFRNFIMTCHAQTVEKTLTFEFYLSILLFLIRCFQLARGYGLAFIAKNQRKQEMKFLMPMYLLLREHDWMLLNIRRKFLNI